MCSSDLDHFIGRVAEESLASTVKRFNVTAVVDHDDRIDGCIEECLEFSVRYGGAVATIGHV